MRIRILGLAAVACFAIVPAAATLAAVNTSGSTFDDGASFYVGYADSSNGTLALDGSSVLSRGTGYVGYTPTSTGTVTVTGPVTSWTNTGNLHIGANGRGTLNVQAGGRVSAYYSTLGTNVGSIGTATVTGSGSKWTTTSMLHVARNGQGTLSIEAGGEVITDFAYIGKDAGSVGAVTVTGAGSKWTDSGRLFIGNNGNGTLSIGQGGRAGNTDAYLGIGPGSSGAVTVTGPVSTWTNTGDLYVGRVGSGSLTVNNGGQVSAWTIHANLSDLHGNGTITASRGAVLDADMVFDGTQTTPLAFSFGTGGSLLVTMANSGFLGAGYKSNGTLTIAGGEDVRCARGYLGFEAGSIGIGTVAGSGSTWTTTSSLSIGQNGGRGRLNVMSQAQVACNLLYIGNTIGSNGAITVTGLGSTLTGTGHCYIGNNGTGTLTVKDGGLVSNRNANVGCVVGALGEVAVTGLGSTWTSDGPLLLGISGTATMTVSDGGLVTARNLRIGANSVARLHVSGNGLVTLGNASLTGSFTNNGLTRLYADAFLPMAGYRPISECQNRTMIWSGTGTIQTLGGSWNSSAKTFTPTTLTALNAGTVDSISNGERMRITNPADGRRVGASFDTVAGSPTFSAAPMSAAERAALAATQDFEGLVLSAWTFNTTLPAGSEAMLSFDLGDGVTDLAVWRYSSGAWQPFEPDLMTYDSHGILSFTVTEFDGYAVTGVPEPTAFALLALGGLAAFGRRRRAAG